MLEEDMFVAGNLDTLEVQQPFLFSHRSYLYNYLPTKIRKRAHAGTMESVGRVGDLVKIPSGIVASHMRGLFPLRLSSMVSLVKAGLRTAIRSRPSLYQSEL